MPKRSLYPQTSRHPYVKKAPLKERTLQVVGPYSYHQQESWPYVSGRQQSPIDIKETQVQNAQQQLLPLQLAYQDLVTKVYDTGMSLQAESYGTALLNGRPFTLKQFHFHGQSEHTLDGQVFPLEAHFVHENINGTLGVVAVFMTIGQENAGFQEVLNNYHTFQKNAATHIQCLLPQNLSYYHYMGSLTTPPLTENVEWYLLKEPVTISLEQLHTFKKLYPDNHRKRQPLNQRPVLFYQG
ncbi:carbonic anhydrase family protein [Enterococcus nangangensis]